MDNCSDTTDPYSPFRAADCVDMQLRGVELKVDLSEARSVQEVEAARDTSLGKASLFIS